MRLDIKVWAIIFILIGIGIFFFSYNLYQDTTSFIKKSMLAKGEVIRLMKRREIGSKSSTYYPVIKFITEDGQKIEFESSAGSNPPSYTEGDEVEVYYDPRNPSRARVSSFFSLWFGAAFTGCAGLLFAFIGTAIIAFSIKKERDEKWLRRYGTGIELDYHNIDLSQAQEIKSGQWQGAFCLWDTKSKTYRIMAQWKVPGDNRTYKTRSRFLAFNPRPFIPENRKIKVWYDLANPRRSFVDLSFLPKKAWYATY